MQPPNLRRFDRSGNARNINEVIKKKGAGNRVLLRVTSQYVLILF